MSIGLQKIDNGTYAFFDPTTKKDVHIFIDEKIGNAEFRYNLAQKTMDVYLSANKSSKEERKEFNLANRKWSLSNENKVGTGTKVASHLSTFVHKHGEDNVVRLRVGEIGKTAVTSIASAAIYVSQQDALRMNMKVENEKTLAREGKVGRGEFSNLTVEEIRQNVKGKLPLNDQALALSNPRFNDPFTKLATLSMQRFETVFRPQDNFLPGNCECYLVKVGDELQLVHKDNKVLCSPENNRETLAFYKEHLIREYGKEKVEHLQYLYGIDLDRAEALTPEHVYRFNIGANNLDTHDLSLFLEKVRGLELPKREMPLEEFLKEAVETQILTGWEARGLFSAIQQSSKQEKPTTEDLGDWMQSLGVLPESLSEMSPEQAHKVMQVFKLSPEEHFAALTGRRIYRSLESGYTLAEHGEYKPWVDGQELLQIGPKLENSRDLITYHERLAFVVSKNHLAREHPTEGYRLGTIIPAPKSANGESRYYKVTSCISNGHGILSYTLESLGDDPSLPPIKLFRSTASAPYALQSTSTVLNDLNALNSPGYEGLGLADEYEMPFFQERTMPIWTGYLTEASKGLAQQEKDLDQVYADLKTANEQLLIDFEQKHQRKDLKGIVRTNDGALNDLLLSDESFWGLVASNVESDFPRIYEKLVRYANSRQKSISSDSLTKERGDAIELLEELEKFPMDDKPSPVQEGVKKLKRELEDHIVSSSANHANKVARAVFNKKIYNKVLLLQHQAEDYLRKGEAAKAEKALQDWREALAEYARANNEGPDGKKFEDIVLTGHSLGGALVQSYCAHAFFNPSRMPLPGQTLYVYEFDGPAINEDDNNKAKRTLFAHEDLYRRLGVEIEYVRRQEYGDIVPIAGQEHLFSPASAREAKQLDDSQVLKLDQAVYERAPDAKDAAVSEALTAHATQFGEGMRRRTFYEDDKTKGDYKETHYSPFIQGIFDSSGNIGSTKEEREKNKKMHKEVFRNLWGLKPLGGLMHAQTAESLRSWGGSPNLLLKKALKDRERVDRSAPFHDKKGVFAVFEQGPVTGEGLASAA